MQRLGWSSPGRWRCAPEVCSVLPAPVNIHPTRSDWSHPWGKSLRITPVPSSDCSTLQAQVPFPRVNEPHCCKNPPGKSQLSPEWTPQGKGLSWPAPGWCIQSSTVPSLILNRSEWSQRRYKCHLFYPLRCGLANNRITPAYLPREKNTVPQNPALFSSDETSRWTQLLGGYKALWKPRVFSAAWSCVCPLWQLLGFHSEHTLPRETNTLFGQQWNCLVEGNQLQ